MNINDLRYSPHSLAMRTLTAMLGVLVALPVAPFVINMNEAKSSGARALDLLGVFVILSIPAALVILWSVRPTARRKDAEFAGYLSDLAADLRAEFSLPLPVDPLYELDPGVAEKSSEFLVETSSGDVLSCSYGIKDDGTIVLFTHAVAPSRTS